MEGVVAPLANKSGENFEDRLYFHGGTSGKLSKT